MQPASPITASINRFFEACLLLLVATGFFAVAVTGKLDFLSVAGVTAALALRAYAFVTHRNWNVPERWTAYLTLLYLAIYALDLMTGTFVNSTVHLVLFSLVVKLFSIHRDRDYVYLAVLAFLAILAASVLTVDAIFLAALIAFIVLAIVTFAAFEIRRSAAAAGVAASDGHLVPERVRRSLMSLTVVLAVAIFVGASIIFFTLPRVTSSYLTRFAPRNQYMTGFSSTVELGDIGRVQQSDSIVMHVQLLPGYKLPQDVYWRGVALSLFDGRRWLNPSANSAGAMLMDGRNVYVPSQQNAVRREMRYRVLMEPIGTNVFFGMPFLETVSGNYRNISVDEFGGFTNFDRDRAVGAYTATSNVGQPDRESLRHAGTNYPAGLALRFLQLPRVDPRVARLARDLTRTETNNFDRAVAIETHLRTKFGYTLELPSRVANDPVADFLFSRKKGHCEYFASSMTIMLRTLGIPARVVNGFRGAELNRISGSYVVRARQAHSWVEAYFPRQGWITFDPTPAAGEAGPEGLGTLAQYYDAAHEFWREWVINYDFSHQRSLGAATIDGSRTKLNQLRDATDRWYATLLERAARAQEKLGREPQRWTGVAVAILVLLIFVINGRRIWRAFKSARLARSPGRAPQKAATIWYSRMEKAIARRGWRKLPSQTPQEFVTTIEDPVLRDSVARFTERYERARFGESAEDAEQLADVFAELSSRPK